VSSYESVKLIDRPVVLPSCLVSLYHRSEIWCFSNVLSGCLSFSTYAFFHLYLACLSPSLCYQAPCPLIRLDARPVTPPHDVIFLC
jgi:hypothetical protein